MPHYQPFGGYYPQPNGGYYLQPTPYYSQPSPYYPSAGAGGQYITYPQPHYTHAISPYYSGDGSLKRQLSRLRKHILKRARHIVRNNDRGVYRADQKIVGTLHDVVYAYPPNQVQERRAFQDVATRFQRCGSRIERNSLLMDLFQGIVVQSTVNLLFGGLGGAGIGLGGVAVGGAGVGFASGLSDMSMIGDGIIQSFFQLFAC